MAHTLTEGLSQPSPTDVKTTDYVYRILDADHPLAVTTRHSLHGVDEVLVGRAETPLQQRNVAAGKATLKLGYLDRWMSSQHAKLTRVIRSWILEDTQSKNGLRLNGVSTHRAELKDGDIFELGHSFFLFRSAQPWLETADVSMSPADTALASISPRLEAQFDELRKVASSSISVALCGPSGSGKEVVARAIHALSARKGPFVAVNCGALPHHLVESLLFGHRKGAFSGANEEHVGFIRSADKGTLLLDEIGDFPLGSQPALLRVLQERSVVPVGAKSPVPVDVRVISATHHNLEAMALEGLFRDDLRARLSGYSMQLPSLEQRREDFGVLLGNLLLKLAPQRAALLQLSLPAARALLAHSWPLNVRELEKALERALALATGTVIDVAHWPTEVQHPPEKRQLPPDVEDDARKAQLEALLQQHGGNVSAVARAMGKARMQIQRWMNRYQLEPRRFKP